MPTQAPTASSDTKVELRKELDGIAAGEAGRIQAGGGYSLLGDDDLGTLLAGLSWLVSC